MENHNSSTEEEKRQQQPQPQSSPFSWWSDSHNRPPHSQWLHSTLAELDDRIKMILDLIEDDGETFAKRAEMYYEKKPQLIKMVQELHRSYRALADKYDQLKSESSIKTSNNRSLSDSFRKSKSLKHKPHISLSPIEAPNFNSESVEEFSAAEGSDDSGTSSFGHQTPKNYTPSVDSDSNNDSMKKADSDEYYSNKSDSFGREVGVIVNEKSWSEPMKFTRLLEENLSTQAELIRRNDEKREVINELRNEKRSMSHKTGGGSSSHDSKVTKKVNQSHKRNLRGLFCLA